MATEDKFVIKIDTSSSIMTVEQLLKKIEKLYKGIATITASSTNAATGVRKYTAEVTKSTLAVSKLADANKRLAGSYQKTNSVSSKLVRGRQAAMKKQPPVPVVPAAVNPYAGLPPGLSQIPPALPGKTMPLPTTMGGKGNGKPPAVMPPYVNPNNFNIPQPKTFGMPAGIGNALDANNLFPASDVIAKQSLRINKMLRGINNGGAGGGTPAGASNIDWVGDGDNRYKPSATAAENRRKQEQRASMGLVRRAKDLNRGFFQMQMSTLGVAFSFMTLQNSIVGIFTSLTDLPGALKGMALGKAFGGVDIAGSMGVDTGQIVEGWKRITGIMSMMQTVFVSFAALVLSPELMDAIAKFFNELGKSLADPKMVAALQALVLAAVDFGYALLPLLPVLADVILALGEAGVLKWLVGFVLMAGVLLSAMSLLGWGFQAVLLVIELLAPWIVATLVPAITGFFAALGIGVGTLLLVIAGVLIIFDVLIRVIQEFWNEGISLQSLFNGLIKAFNDVYNVVVWVMNAISGLLGMGSMFKSNVPLDWLLGGGGSSSTTTSTNINNTYVLNGTYSNGRDNIKMLNQTSNRSPS
jgi:hypothetical protein